MTMDPKEAQHVVVSAIRRSKWGGGCIVGYFKTRRDVPSGWEYFKKDGIDDIMESIGTTDVDRCLRMMNSHWQR